MAPITKSHPSTAHTTKTLEQLRFDNRYARLPTLFHSAHRPIPLHSAHLVHFNHAASALIDLDPTQAARDDFVNIIAGTKLLPGFQPIACCYAGHQFGHLVPRLGDGRAILLGEVLNDDASRWDLHLKGAGQTHYSRGGDGRAVLRSSIREYLCSEAMHGLGIGTTRALCLIGSDEVVYREQAEPGAMLLRMAPSHVRFGTFEYFYYARQFDALKILADYVLQMHFPHLLACDNPYLALLIEVIGSTAKLIAQWQAVGFMHGVMNTDNMSIHGIAIDYGPFKFMEIFDAGHIGNHSDHSGRYAYNQQAEIGLFNLRCFAQALVPLFDPVPEKSAELATIELHCYQDRFSEHYTALVYAKLGLFIERDGDWALCQSLFESLQANQVDFTRFFRTLSDADQGRRCANTRVLFEVPSRCDDWLARYHARLADESLDDEIRSARMRQVNPKYVLRNHMAETAIRQMQDEGNSSEIERLMKLLATPFDEHPSMEPYAQVTPEWGRCLAISCSS